MLPQLRQITVQGRPNPPQISFDAVRLYPLKPKDVRLFRLGGMKMKHSSTRGYLLGSLTVAALLLGSREGQATHQLVRRNIGSYFILGLREVGLKNLDLRSDLGVCPDPATAFLNVGVNCEGDAFVRHCGNLRMETAHVFSPGQSSQVVADTILNPRPGGNVFAPTTTLDQVFQNGLPLPPQAIINDPPEQAVALPILPGTCDAFCEPDIAAVQTLCNFPAVFPSCDPNTSLTIRAASDCLPYDTNLGNNACDLPPGDYGFVKMAAGGSVLTLQAGDYTFCTFKAGAGSRVNGNGAVMRIVAGRLGIGNSTALGQGCGDLTIQSNSTKPISFGKQSSVAANLCAPQAKVKLGHNNSLTGQFIGLQVTSDRDNVGHVCCN